MTTTTTKKDLTKPWDVLTVTRAEIDSTLNYLMERSGVDDNFGGRLTKAQAKLVAQARVDLWRAARNLRQIEMELARNVGKE